MTGSPIYCLLRGRHSEAAHEKRLLCAQKCTRGGVRWGGSGHVGVGWDGVVHAEGGVCHAGVGWGGVGWVMQGWGWVGWGGVCHAGVGWGGSCRGRVGMGGSCRGWGCVKQGWGGVG